MPNIIESPNEECERGQILESSVAVFLRNGRADRPPQNRAAGLRAMSQVQTRAGPPRLGEIVAALLPVGYASSPRSRGARGRPSGKERFGPSIQGGDTPMICVRSRGCRRAIIWLGLCCAILGSANTARGDVISVTNLVTDDQAVNSAQITDPFLKNAWGISHSTGSPFWVSDNA